MAENQQRRVYRAGDNIRIALQLSDESGVGKVRAAFIGERDAGSRIYLVGDGGGARSAKVVLEAAVTESTPAGEYQCRLLDMVDGLGNRSTLENPGIEFRVEKTREDTEGPRYSGCDFD